MSASVTPLRPKRKCSECGKPSDRASFPFCSPRCKSVDLHRWLTGAYVIPGAPDEAGSEDDPER